MSQEVARHGGTAVYLCSCGTIIPERVDLNRVAAEIEGLQDISRVEHIEFLCSEEGKAQLLADLANRQPDRVVLAACSPRDHESTFRSVLGEAGLNPYLLQMANIREHVSWVTEDPESATRKAVRYVRAAISRVQHHEALTDEVIDANPNVLILGAGPAGLKAAVTAAEAGREVVLVEKAPHIGGLPVLYEEVFPAMECGPCMLEPLEDEILHGEISSRIELLTQARLEGVEGFYGNFIAHIRQAPAFVDPKGCLGCAMCVEVCPSRTVLDTACGEVEKRAIAFSMPGALPNIPVLDPDLCLNWNGEECAECQNACPIPGVIDLEAQEQTLDRSVGAVLVAVGSQLLDCSRLPNLGYGVIKDVCTNLELERMLASNGPTSGEIRTSQGTPPKSVSFVHCVGSLNSDHQEYCSGICCQEALKLNHLLRRRLPGVRLTHFYREMVTPGKEEFQLYAETRNDPDTKFVRYEGTSGLQISERGELKVVALTGEAGKMEEETCDLVVLCPAVVPGETSGQVSRLLGIQRDRWGFFSSLHSRMNSSSSSIRGVYLAGSCQAPVNITQAINQGMAATAQLLSGLTPGKQLEVSPVKASVEETRCSGCRVCLPVCPYRAISLVDETGKARVNKVLCMGCGTCVASCPSGAMQGNHFTSQQIISEIQGVLG